MPYTQISPTQEQQLLELFDYCQKQTNAVVTDDVKHFEKNGMLSLTSIHWFQLMAEYIMPVLLEKRYMIQDRFYTVCLQYRTQHPIDFLYEKYQAILNNESLSKVTTHDYMKKIEEKGGKKSKK